MTFPIFLILFAIGAGLVSISWIIAVLLNAIFEGFKAIHSFYLKH
jgi:hypothetical protein